MPPLKIGYLTQKDALDPQIWSGTIHRMYRALAEHAGDVEIIGPRPRPLWLRLLWHYLNGIRRLFGQKLGIVQSVPLSLAYSAYFGRQLRHSSCDVVLAPIAACETAFLKTDKPVFYLSDTTFKAQTGYYFQPSEMSALGRWEANLLEQRALDRADTILYSNAWAAESAVRDYHADPQKIHVIPFGANFTQEPERFALGAGADGLCRLLFVSRDWNRKGGPIALDALRSLRARGMAAHLTIVGCSPPEGTDEPGVTVIPSLDKRIPAQEQQFTQLYRDADFFLLPTRAECSAIVFCEASAFGLPTVGTDTGGTSSVVVEGENGFLLPLDAPGERYADAIERLWSDPQAYARLRSTTRGRFESDLNWKVWAERVRALMEQRLGHHASSE